MKKVIVFLTVVCLAISAHLVFANGQTGGLGEPCGPGDECNEGLYCYCGICVNIYRWNCECVEDRDLKVIRCRLEDNGDAGCEASEQELCPGDGAWIVID